MNTPLRFTPGLPSYRTDPGTPNSLTQLIIPEGLPNSGPHFAHRLQFISSFQGESDYRDTHATTRRVTFRWAKCPWIWGFEKPGQKYWNYANEEEFQRDFNGAWGILHEMANPVDAETLEAFRREHLPNAVTGYYDHLKKQWVVCEPTTRKLGTETWELSPEGMQFSAELKSKPAQERDHTVC